MWVKLMGCISWQEGQAMVSACCAIGSAHLEVELEPSWSLGILTKM